MATSSGSSTQITNSGSEEDLQVLMNERKRKRMQSNRESARRSRMRKQQHLDELMAQAAQLKKENSHIQSKIGLTTQHFMTVEAENSVLRAQMMELSQRLESLNEILSYMNNTTNSSSPPSSTTTSASADFDVFEDFHQIQAMMMNGNNNPLMFFNPQQQPIMAASADFFQY